MDDPLGAGGTTLNGLNDNGMFTGFYVDGAGNTHGMLATNELATAAVPEPSTLELVLLPALAGMGLGYHLASAEQGIGTGAALVRRKAKDVSGFSREGDIGR